MFAIHHRRNFNTPDDFVVVGNGFRTIEQAAQSRGVAGDLVVDQYTGVIVKSLNWLFDWEKKDPACYARKAIASGV